MSIINEKTTPISDFFLDVATGSIPKHSFIQKFGTNSDIDTGTTPEDIWAYGGLYNFSTTADIDSFSSSSASDTQELVVFGLDENWEDTQQTVTLNGQNTVTLSTPLIRIYRALNNGATELAGDVYCYINGATVSAGVPTTDTDVRAFISVDDNQTLMGIYTIPEGKTGYLYQTSVSYAKSTGTFAIVQARARTFGGVFRTIGTVVLQGQGSSYVSTDSVVPRAIPARTDILLRCTQVEANGTGISGAFDILLIDD